MEATSEDEGPAAAEVQSRIPVTPCVGISDAARHFLVQSGSVQWGTVDLGPEGLVELRDENSQAAAAGCQQVQAETCALVEDSVVGGVSVQWVAPEQVCGPEVVLFLHGGGFVTGKPEDDLSMTARLATYLSRRVCVPRYRLAPEHPFPAARDDAMAVYRELVDGASVVVIGESAGGNLALGLVLGIAEATLPSPKAVALFSPWVDLTHSGDSHIIGELAGLDPTLSVKHFLEPAAQAYAGGQPLESAAISPLFDDFQSANFPPTIISSGSRDLLLSDGIRLATKLRAAAVVVELTVAEGLWHVFEWYPELPEAAASLQIVASFLNKFLKQE